jgi:predicted AAA+ superfamily ATPase
MIKRLLNIPERQHFLLLGPRQTGKTTLIKEYLTSRGVNHLFINLAEEDKFFRYLKNPSLIRGEVQLAIAKQNITEVFVDEVQRVPAILNEIQNLIDTTSVRFILTGSSARKLMRGSANLLGGRAVLRELFPLTSIELSENFSLDYVLRFGSLPRVFQAHTDAERADLLSAYNTLYLKEEIQAEGLVRNLPGFSKFLDVAAQNSGELLNYKAIGDDIGIPGRSVQSYYELLEETLIAIRLSPFERSIRRRLRKHDKIYLFDLGVLNALQQTVASAHAAILRGKLFEHFIILETYRLLKYCQKEISICFWRTKDDEEVDLVFLKGGEPFLACEIKSSSTITSLALKGLSAFHSEHAHVERIIVAPVDVSFELEGVSVLTVKDFIGRVLAMV